MSLMKYFKRKSNKTAASVAKERLQIIVSHEHAEQSNPDFIQRLQNELIDVISKYIKIDRDNIRVQLERSGEQSVLELNVTLSEEVLEAVS